MTLSGMMKPRRLLGLLLSMRAMRCGGSGTNTFPVAATQGNPISLGQRSYII